MESLEQQIVMAAPAGNGSSDLAIYRYDDEANSGRFAMRMSSNPNAVSRIVERRSNGDIPVEGDFDGDGSSDVAAISSVAQLKGSEIPIPSVVLVSEFLCCVYASSQHT